MKLVKWSRVAGIVLQGLILGIGLFLAIGRLVGMDAAERLFRYQAF